MPYKPRRRDEVPQEVADRSRTCSRCSVRYVIVFRESASITVPTHFLDGRVKQADENGDYDEQFDKRHLKSQRSKVVGWRNRPRRDIPNSIWFPRTGAYAGGRISSLRRP
jgi:hypothetical protein